VANYQIKPLAPGLYFVATPIGTARDITLRALDVLASADVLAAEDTRTLKHLLEIHGIPLGDRWVIAYHDHNGAKVRPKLIEAISKGQSVAYASDAGTPLVADPGFALARDVLAQDLPVTSAPGPSAVLTALTIAGLPTDRFFFAGFLPSTAAARKKALRELTDIPATLVLFEGPRRVHSLLTDVETQLGGDRPAAVCRELTKKFEEVARGTVAELSAAFSDRSVKGEVVVLIGRAPVSEMRAEDVEEMLRTHLETMSVKDAATSVAEATGLPRRTLYQQALALKS
jgi:16S rRNA (cytidine1402-2'-O)-methyltransferase